jgi:hypothetical protein
MATFHFRTIGSRASTRTAHSSSHNVTRSAFGAATPTLVASTYIVAVNPPASTGLGRMLMPNLTVTGGSETSLGTVILP